MTFDRPTDTPEGERRRDVLALFRFVEMASGSSTVAKCVRTNGSTDGTETYLVSLTGPVPASRVIAAARLAPSAGDSLGGTPVVWRQIDPGAMPRLGYTACTGPEDEPLPSDDYRWVKLRDVTATCAVGDAWTLTDSADAISRCTSSVVEQIILARYMGSQPVQPNREVVVVPLLTSGSADPIRWVIAHMDDRDNGESCEIADKCYYKHSYLWSCENDEVHQDVTFVEVRCGAPGPDMGQVGRWISKGKTYGYAEIVEFVYWQEGDACDPQSEEDCPGWESSELVAPAPPTAKEIAEACIADQKKCDNPVVNVYMDADFMTVEYCDGTTKKFATCCNESPGTNFCWYQFEAQWDCATEDRVAGSMRWVAGDCAPFDDARSTAWVSAGKTGNIATLTKWVRSTQVCDADTDCDTSPPITVFPEDYPNAEDVAAAGGCADVVNDCPTGCDCDGAGTEHTLQNTTSPYETEVVLEGGKVYCFEYVSGATQSTASGGYYNNDIVATTVSEDYTGASHVGYVGNPTNYNSAAEAEAGVTNTKTCIDLTGESGDVTVYFRSRLIQSSQPPLGGSTDHKFRICELPA